MSVRSSEVAALRRIDKDDPVKFIKTLMGNDATVLDLDVAESALERFKIHDWRGNK